MGRLPNGPSANHIRSRSKSGSRTTTLHATRSTDTLLYTTTRAVSQVHTGSPYDNAGPTSPTHKPIVRARKHHMNIQILYSGSRALPTGIPETVVCRILMFVSSIGFLTVATSPRCSRSVSPCVLCLTQQQVGAACGEACWIPTVPRLPGSLWGFTWKLIELGSWASLVNTCSNL